MAESLVFGERLKRRRVALGLTLAALSEAVGIHLQSLAKIESGDRAHPRWDTVVALCRALNVTPDYFFDPDANDLLPDGADEPSEGAHSSHPDPAPRPSKRK